MNKQRKAEEIGLKEYLILILADLHGGPVPLNLIMMKLDARGWGATKSAVVHSLERNNYFVKTARSYYGLACAIRGEI